MANKIFKSIDFGSGDTWFPLPIVSDTDNDKVLMVIDGEWTVTDAKIGGDDMTVIDDELDTQIALIDTISTKLGLVASIPTGTQEEKLQINNTNLTAIAENADQGGGNKNTITVDGIPQENSIALVSARGDFRMSTLPYAFERGCVVTFNNEIHILGDASSTTTGVYHYKWNEASGEWVVASTLPYRFYNGAVVVYNGELHILGSYNSANRTYHYKWDGSTWQSVSTLPYTFYYGQAAVLNNEIHILGGIYSSTASNNYSTKHFKWNGAEWSEVSTLPYAFAHGAAVVYKEEIHILGGGTGNTAASLSYHYKWNGSTWESVSTIPLALYQSSAVVLYDELYIMGSYSTETRGSWYKWDGITWTAMPALPFLLYQGGATVIDDEIHILGGAASGEEQKHFVLQRPYYYIYGADYEVINEYTDEVLAQMHLIQGIAAQIGADIDVPVGSDENKLQINNTNLEKMSEHLVIQNAEEMPIDHLPAMFIKDGIWVQEEIINGEEASW